MHLSLDLRIKRQMIFSCGDDEILLISVLCHGETEDEYVTTEASSSHSRFFENGPMV